MKKNAKKQVYIENGTTYLTYNDCMRAYRKRDREMHNWKVQTGLFCKGKLWRPRKQSRRIQLDKAQTWVDRRDMKMLAQWERERRHWSWERI